MMNQIRILSDLGSVPDGANCALIIRHGDRDGAMNQIVKQDECLNEMGQQRSEHLGKELRRFVGMKTFSSPVGRCVDTCAHIAKGYGLSLGPERTELLGMSAPFMVDLERAYLKMREVGLLGFVQSYIDDELDPAMVLSCPEGTRLLLSYAIDKMRGMRNGVDVLVTHDMIITPPMAYYFGYDIRKNGLAPFLDGIVLFEDDGRFYVQHNGRRLSVDGTGRVIR